MTDHQKNSRLNKYLALHLGISRREADIMIEKGSVTVNGEKAILGTQITDTDSVAVSGAVITARTAYKYIILNKPTGYVCSRRPQGTSPTVYSLLPRELHDLKLVGRLDKDSSGLIMLTNDGDFAHRMTHPKFAKTKIYYVRLDHELEPLHQQMISDIGIQLDDGRSQLLLQRRSESTRKEWQITMSEGRNRQIRRTFAALGYTVLRLHRVQFGTYTIETLKPGSFIETNT